ncbi:ABC transporter ATP-binding protein [Paenibacillus validus]|uniref:ABC transporter ATP-binding protein n=1 Tax=Paenibacillus validus TaxID=44253 RepID=UPI000FDB04A6|nr:ABC transporter ATP-binding protein [Paenibacillus validus]MED4599464.1 ABC transporter ATP-binding protein [Paenibacillus validus]MED4605176.1 ABC transporter ATP-binding protein [Paenibacillus validus]
MSSFNHFLPYVSKQKKLYILGFVGSLFRFLIPLCVPLVIKYLFDELLQNEALSYAAKIQQLLLIAAIMLVVFFLIRGPMEYVRQFFMHKANNNIIKALRTDAFHKIHSLDTKYFTENKSGEVGSRLFDDIEKIRGFMTAVFSNIWIETVVLGFVVSVMLTLNVKLTLLAVLLVGIQFALAHLLSRRLKTTTRQMMSYRSILSGFIFEKIQGAFWSKLFSAERKDKEELDQHLIHYERLTDHQARMNAISLASVNVLSDVTPFIVVLVGSLYVIDGGLTLGTLIAFFAYVDRMRSPVTALVQAFPAITEGSVALQRMFEFLHTPVTIKEKDRPYELKEFTDSITFHHVSFSYNNEDKVIKDLSFTLQKGKTYAFVGESGGGKSTILQLLTRMYDADGGEILIDGVNIKDYSISSLRNQMGIVTQDNFLYSSSVKDNIRMARLDAADEEVIAAAKKAFAHDFICALPNGYDTEIGERGIKLSGGQKQRLALARVFLKDPALILLDEATSALDNESEKLVQKSIYQIGREKTIIMIAHRLSTVLEADTIFVVKNGSIVESGNHKYLMELNGYYKELYNGQNAVGVLSSPSMSGFRRTEVRSGAVRHA